jgi:EAL domain-containing protein (putative c-di-GMP-specific phosphodiesterase class I)
VKKELIVDRQGNLYGFEILTQEGREGNDKGAISRIIKEIAPYFQRGAKMFVNLPPSALFSEEIARLLSELKTYADLVVEVIETEKFDPLSLPDLGIPYALDDYGTGYASLCILLRALESRLFHYIKIDREAFAVLLKDKEGKKFLSSLCTTIKNAGKRVIFEKVETEEEFLQLAFLSPEDTLFQGFYVEKTFGRAL